MPNLLPMAAKKLGKPSLSESLWAQALPLLSAHVGHGRRFSNKQLAEALGLSQPSVSAWFRKKGKPTLANLVEALRFVGEDPLAIPELARALGSPADPLDSVSGLHDRLLQLADFLVLDHRVVLTGWSRTGRPAGPWVDVWEGLPDYVRKAAMAAVYLWGYPIEQVCEAAQRTWGSMSESEREDAGRLPITWCNLLLRELPRRPGSGTMVSPMVGNLGQAGGG